MNKLDGKCIVDRELLERILFCYEITDNTLQEALAQDLTGWVATVAKPSESMLVESAGELPEYRPDDPEWDQLEYEIVSAERHMSAEIYRTMLEASPPMPGGGE